MLEKLLLRWRKYMAHISKDKRGLASADQKTKERVARMGGQAFYEKRGAKGSDSRVETTSAD
jgi:hypothetical protein